MRHARLAMAVGLVFMAAGCGDDDPSTFPGPTPTSTATTVPRVPTPAIAATGPVITFVGITRADDVLVEPVATSPDGVPIYPRLAGSTGAASGFRLVIEGKEGPSGRGVALATFNEVGLPDLQIQSNRPLGNGSVAVCDTAQPTPGPGTASGGVPAIDPPSFDPAVEHRDALNDLGCRFRDGGGNPSGVSRDDGCVKIEPTEEYGFVSDQSEVQFCGFMSGILGFPVGDTLLTVRLRDVEGNVGAPARMIIRVN